MLLQKGREHIQQVVDSTLPHKLVHHRLAQHRLPVHHLPRHRLEHLSLSVLQTRPHQTQQELLVDHQSVGVEGADLSHQFLVVPEESLSELRQFVCDGEEESDGYVVVQVFRDLNVLLLIAFFSCFLNQSFVVLFCKRLLPFTYRRIIF